MPKMVKIDGAESTFNLAKTSEIRSQCDQRISVILAHKHWVPMRAYEELQQSRAEEQRAAYDLIFLQRLINKEITAHKRNIKRYTTAINHCHKEITNKTRVRERSP